MRASPTAEIEGCLAAGGLLARLSGALDSEQKLRQDTGLWTTAVRAIVLRNCECGLLPAEDSPARWGGSHALFFVLPIRKRVVPDTRWAHYLSLAHLIQQGLRSRHTSHDGERRSRLGYLTSSSQQSTHRSTHARATPQLSTDHALALDPSGSALGDIPPFELCSPLTSHTHAPRPPHHATSGGAHRGGAFPTSPEARRPRVGSPRRARECPSRRCAKGSRHEFMLHTPRAR